MASNIASISTGAHSVVYCYTSDNTLGIHKSANGSATGYGFHNIITGNELSVSSDYNRMNILKSCTIKFNTKFATTSGDGKLTYYIYKNGSSIYSSASGTGTYTTLSFDVASGDYIEIYRSNAVAYWEDLYIWFFAT